MGITCYAVRMESTASLLWTILFSAIGMGFFVYGTRQKVAVPFVTGVALMLFPYFIDNVYLLVLIGAGLCVVPYYLRF